MQRALMRRYLAVSVRLKLMFFRTEDKRITNYSSLLAGQLLSRQGYRTSAA